MRQGFADGFRLLAARVLAHGLSRDLRARGTGKRVADSPFYRLKSSADALLDAWAAGGDVAAAVAAFRGDSGACRKEARALYKRRYDRGWRRAHPEYMAEYGRRYRELYGPSGRPAEGSPAT